MEDTKCIPVFCSGKILKGDMSLWTHARVFLIFPERFLRQGRTETLYQGAQLSPRKGLRARSHLADILDPVTLLKVQVTPQWGHKVSVIKKPIIRGKVLTHTIYGIFPFKQNKIIANNQM